MLSGWALDLPKYNFQILYHKGVLNANVDALSRLESCSLTLTLLNYSTAGLQTAQQVDIDLGK